MRFFNFRRFLWTWRSLMMFVFEKNIAGIKPCTWMRWWSYCIECILFSALSNDWWNRKKKTQKQTHLKNCCAWEGKSHSRRYGLNSRELTKFFYKRSFELFVWHAHGIIVWRKIWIEENTTVLCIEIQQFHRNFLHCRSIRSPNGQSEGRMVHVLDPGWEDVTRYSKVRTMCSTFE